MQEGEMGNKYDRTPPELQQYILTCILSAGKRADFARDKVNAITADVPPGVLPCEWMLRQGDLESHLRKHRTGKYNTLTKAIARINELDLAIATEGELRSVPGIGFKTSRILLVRSRPNVNHAVLDTWTLKFLRDNGVLKVPEVTPGSECEYVRLETELLRLYSEQFPGLTPAEADEKVWLHYSGRG